MNMVLGAVCLLLVAYGVWRIFVWADVAVGPVGAACARIEWFIRVRQAKAAPPTYEEIEHALRHVRPDIFRQAMARMARLEVFQVGPDGRYTIITDDG